MSSLIEQKVRPISGSIVVDVKQDPKKVVTVGGGTARSPPMTWPQRAPMSRLSRFAIFTVLQPQAYTLNHQIGFNVDPAAGADSRLGAAWMSIIFNRTEF